MGIYVYLKKALLLSWDIFLSVTDRNMEFDLIIDRREIMLIIRRPFVFTTEPTHSMNKVITRIRELFMILSKLTHEISIVDRREIMLDVE